MPQGKGTYGSKVGRPRKKKEEGKSLLNNDRQQYAEGTGDDDDDATVDVAPVGGTADEKNVPYGQQGLTRTNPNSTMNQPSKRNQNISKVEGAIGAYINP